MVRGFTPAGFTVDGDTYRALLLTPEQAASWAPPPLAELTAESLQPLLTLDPPPEFLLLGTGPILVFPPRALVASLEARGIGVEAMDSRAAARTWGLLRAEGRWIVAAILPL